MDRAPTPKIGNVEWVAPSKLKHAPRNARTHTKKQIDQIAASIKRFGFVNPALVSGESQIVAGHGRIEAAKLIGMVKVPVLRLENMSEADLRAYALADNRIAEAAGWDRELLAAEFEYLSQLNVEFDLSITGFETAEIDILLGDEESVDEDPPCEPQREFPAVSQPGDLWLIGKHRLLCGDARKDEDFRTLMGGKVAQLIFTDSPYNLKIDGNVCGLGSIKHREFAMASGEMSQAEFTAFLSKVLHHLSAFSTDGSVHFICMDWRHLEEILVAGKAKYTKLLNLCVWNKTNAGMGSLYRSKHELILVFKSGAGRHVNNIELGRHGRYRTNVWDYPGNNTLGKGRAERLACHPTTKPVELVADAIRDCSNRGRIVLDPFVGSGTTLLAAAKTGRIGCGMEIDPYYVDAALSRLQGSTGLEPVHAETGLTFEEMRLSRSKKQTIATKNTCAPTKKEKHHGG